MSFAYALRRAVQMDDGRRCVIGVFSDTKVELSGAVELNWPTKTRRAVQCYGICKTMIVCPQISVSFAGNKIGNAHLLLQWALENSPFEPEDFIREAFDLHRKAPSYDDIEFILVVVDEDNRDAEIVCIKEGNLDRRCDSAWIGSYNSFRRMQESRARCGFERVGSLVEFEDVIYSNADETVGGYAHSIVLLADGLHYGEYLTTSTYRPQAVPAGGNVRLFDCIEDGGYTVQAYECEGEPCLSFPQIGKSVLYSCKFRYEEEAIDSPC